MTIRMYCWECSNRINPGSNKHQERVHSSWFKTQLEFVSLPWCYQKKDLMTTVPWTTWRLLLPRKVWSIRVPPPNKKKVVVASDVCKVKLRGYLIVNILLSHSCDLANEQVSMHGLKLIVCFRVISFYPLQLIKHSPWLFLSEDPRVLHVGGGLFNSIFGTHSLNLPVHVVFESNLIVVAGAHACGWRLILLG